MSKPVILVVDDSLTVRICIARILREQECVLAFAEDGLSALAAVADLCPALVVLDVSLPCMDGYDICQLLRKKAWYKDMPILLLTGKHSAIDKMHGHLVGATEYLTKPIDANTLIPLVQKYLAHWQNALFPLDLQDRPKRRQLWFSPTH